jgi:hypothetical protein
MTFVCSEFVKCGLDVPDSRGVALGETRSVVETKKKEIAS